MNGLHDVAQVAHEIINLTPRDHERQGHFYDVKVVTAFQIRAAHLAIVAASIGPWTMPARQVARIPKRPKSPTRHPRSSISTMTLLEFFPRLEVDLLRWYETVSVRDRVIALGICPSAFLHVYLLIEQPVRLKVVLEDLCNLIGALPDAVGVIAIGLHPQMVPVFIEVLDRALGVRGSRLKQRQHLVKGVLFPRRQRLALRPQVAYLLAHPVDFAFQGRQFVDDASPD